MRSACTEMIGSKQETNTIQTNWPELVDHRVLLRSRAGTRLLEAEVVEVSGQGMVKLRVLNVRGPGITWVRPQAVAVIEDLGRGDES